MNILTDKQKTQKAQHIALIAKKEFETKPYKKITMETIASNAKISKGSLFNYYKNKESLFMVLLLEGYCSYFEELLATIKTENELSLQNFLNLLVKEVNHLVNNYFSLLRLNSLRIPILEYGADMTQTIDYRKKLYAVNEKLGKMICSRVPSLTVHEVSQLLLAQSAIISGFMNMSSLDEFQQKPLWNEEFADFRIDLKRDATQAFKYYLKGRYPNNIF